MKKALYLGAIILFGTVLVVSFFLVGSKTLSYVDFQSMMASVFFVDSVTADGLKEKYKDATKGVGRVRVLIVPGHDEESPGASFKRLREVDLTASVGEELYKLFSSDPQFEPILVRDKNGYTKEFAEYFDSKKLDVSAFVSNKRKIMQDLNKNGLTHRVDGGIVHNNALPGVVSRLYSINKWANENKADIVIHLHFNDYPGRKSGREGRYSGYSIYVPEKQFSNSKASQAMAKIMQAQFSKFYASSDLPLEDSGVVPTQDLIAIGAYNTLDAVGMLIEYGYIYEDRFQNSAVREAYLKELAYQTYTGVNKFFGKFEEMFLPYETSLLPHTFEETLREGVRGNRSVLSLQAALVFEDVYPPNGDKRACPITGSFGPCTTSAVKKFQEKYGITNSGVVGELTMRKLNELYGR